MYLPSLLLGGSSILHLLAGHPRVVAFFGIAAAVSMLVYSPFASQPVPGTARYVHTLEARLQADESVDAAAVERARAAARELHRSPATGQREIVDETLRACGDGCRGLTVAMVMQDETMLSDALLVHELGRIAEPARNAGGARGEGLR